MDALVGGVGAASASAANLLVTWAGRLNRDTCAANEGCCWFLPDRLGRIRYRSGCVRPAVGKPGRLGVIILIGGPQYRAGAHRQFVHLARSLADEGIACLRFDFRGMGDSSGEARTFRFVGNDPLLRSSPR